MFECYFADKKLTSPVVVLNANCLVHHSHASPTKQDPGELLHLLSHDVVQASPLTLHTFRRINALAHRRCLHHQATANYHVKTPHTRSFPERRHMHTPLPPPSTNNSYAKSEHSTPSISGLAFVTKAAIALATTRIRLQSPTTTTTPSQISPVTSRTRESYPFLSAALDRMSWLPLPPFPPLLYPRQRTAWK